MASSNESNEKLRNDEDTNGVEAPVGQSSQSTDLAAEGPKFEPFDPEDPWRAARTAEVVSNTRKFLQGLQVEPVGFQDATPKQLRRLDEDAYERSTWSEARQNDFAGILRLGRRTPSRSQRIL